MIASMKYYAARNSDVMSLGAFHLQSLLHFRQLFFPQIIDFSAYMAGWIHSPDARCSQGPRGRLRKDD